MSDNREYKDSVVAKINRILAKDDLQVDGFDVDFGIVEDLNGVKHHDGTQVVTIYLRKIKLKGGTE